MDSIQYLYDNYAKIKFALQDEQAKTKMSNSDFIELRNYYKNMLSALLTSIDNVLRLGENSKKLTPLRERVQKIKNELSMCVSVEDFIKLDI